MVLMDWMTSGALGSNGLHVACGVVVTALTGTVWRMRRQYRTELTERWRERRMREELEAYARLHPGIAASIAGGMTPVDAMRSLSMRVCRVVADKSAFSKVGMLLRDVEGRLYCAGRVGVDDLTVKAMEEWGAKVVAEERTGVRRAGAPKAAADRGGVKSFSIPLGEWKDFDAEIHAREMEGKRERRQFRRGLVAPVRMSSGKLMGAIIVAADASKPGWAPGLERAMGPLETLASRIAAALENEALGERLVRAEKLAGLGQLAGGVAHALNNPLTAVLGFAELISETANEPRVRKDAAVILTEALKMKDTVQRLTEFWKPAGGREETVDVALMLREVADSCEAKLDKRGVKLMLSVEQALPYVRGNQDRLKQVLEHLLNNAAQAISVAGESLAEDGAHTIRITASHDKDAVHLIVSDTGGGFRDPARVFDPFYTTRQPEQGAAGLGLSLCFGIVREHAGEISAFNLHPRGAAVVVELPVKRTLHESGERQLVRQGAGG
jgi:signal transduction histidine kinase